MVLSQGNHTYSELTTTSFLFPACPAQPGNGCSVPCLPPCGTGAEVTAALGSGLPREQGPQAVGSCCLTTSRSRALPDLVALGELLHPSPVFSPVTAEGQGDLVVRTPVMHTHHSLDLAHPRRSPC